MIAWVRSQATTLLLSVTIVLAAGAGVLAAVALGATSQAPARTVTIDVATGPQGPPGPKGDPGEPGLPGAESCPDGYTFSAIVFNAPGGQQQIATCLKG
jgi:hypothetical protein